MYHTENPTLRRLSAGLVELFTIFVFFTLLFPDHSEAQDTVSFASCGYPLNSKLGLFERYALGGEITGSMSGGEGLDRIAFTGPITKVLGRGIFREFELVEIKNGQFDSLVVLGEFLQSADYGEVEIQADWFDTVVLDPRLDWTHLPSPSFSDELYKTKLDGDDLQVRVPIGTFVVTGNDLSSILSTEGPLGRYSLDFGAAAGPDVQVEEATQDDVSETTLTWKVGGVARPDLSSIRHNADRVVLNLNNSAANLVEIATGHLLSWHTEDIHLLLDELDRVTIADPNCWTLQGHTDATLMRLSSKQEDGRSAQIHLPKPILEENNGRAPVVGHAEQSTVFHLSYDTRRVLDAIDLTNGVKDYFIIRNDGRLRSSPQTTILGDPGLDEIWLDGSSGWAINFTDYGLVATTPRGFQREPLQIRFAPELVLRKMPMPGYLQNPKLLDQPHYPGARDESSEAERIYVTRGGYVRFSRDQLANRREIDMSNGRQNIFLLREEDLTRTAPEFEIRGDFNLDLIDATEMPEPSIREDGSYVWQISGPTGLRTITAKTLRVIR
ncbi:hypothetical protein [Roseibium sp. RKSG952]|uniref:hypothetical protein n=1 Tax=Roseibium sp. RKSG952 TaxID=2529384 RepID=UPI0012BB69DC|nr:hypothetical protein [Roseibium sp. RKSG952]MTI03323.1 hypothetical protein [Roseibium sp. RKSG952]